MPTPWKKWPGGYGRMDSALVDAVMSIRFRYGEPAHLRPNDADHRNQYTGVSGLGPVTWEYFTMLLSHPGVEADTWITEFVGRVVRRRVRSEFAGALVKRLPRNSAQGRRNSTTLSGTTPALQG